MHPESPGRLKSVMEALSSPAFEELDRATAPIADPSIVSLGHDPEYVSETLASIPTSGRKHLDPDTVMSPASGEAALRSVGAACAAVDAILAGEIANAFCATRPPGHHAEYARAMGFCLFNTVSVAARYARSRHGLKRAAVVDFDVHHGNGTQHSFLDDPDLFFGSSHQMPAYPGTGDRTETGVANTNVNVPLPPGAGSTAFRRAWEREIIPALEAFAPDIIVISAGFDAHADDPLAQLNVRTHDYAWVTDAIMDTAERVCHGRIVSSLEGGYDLAALGECVSTHVATLMRN